jgi:ATP-dependent exoDNAse (exonuclease V) beta subunit
MNKNLVNKNSKESLKFVSKTHKYRVGKKELHSVTKMVGKLFKPFDAKEVARKLASFPVNKLAKRGVRYWLAEWKKSADYGTEVHNALEDYANGEEVSLVDENYFKGKELLDQYLSEGYHLFPEVRVFDEEVGLAGTIDLVMIKGDEVVLLDWKTNKKITTKAYGDSDKGLYPLVSHLDNCKINLYYLQLLVYSYILEKNYGLKSALLRLAHLRDGKANLYEFSVDEGFREELISLIKSNIEEE